MTHILMRGDTAAIWTSTNPVLMEREWGFETDTGKVKFGDGATAWALLAYKIDLSGFVPANSPTFTGDPKAPTPATADNDTSIATTAFVKAQGYAPLASPTFTGDPKAPTPATSDNDTSIATTAYVKAQGYAPLASPALTGTPTAPTALTADNSTTIATTAWVKAQGYGGGGGGGAPLDSPAFTGNPTAPTPTAGDNDTSIATTAFVATSFAPLASPTFTGDPKAPTPSTADNDTSIATTAFVKAQGYAPLASPALTGNPTAPTPTAGDNDTSVATTAFVTTALAGYVTNTGGGKEAVTTLSATTGTCTGNLASASVFTVVPSGNITLAFSNIPASGVAVTTQVDFVCGATVPTITYPSGTIHAGGSAVAAVANKTLSVTMQTLNGGTNWKCSGVVFG